MIYAATGHRPDKLFGYGKEAYDLLTHIAEDIIQRLDVRPVKVISGMALGWDQAWARAARRLKIPFIAAIPSEDQPNRWPKESRHVWKRFLKTADEVVDVSQQQGYRTLDFFDQLQKRNEWMVDHCDQLVALWNGSAGGTANCVTYAHRKSVTVLGVWGRYLEIKDGL